MQAGAQNGSRQATHPSHARPPRQDQLDCSASNKGAAAAQLLLVQGGG